MFFVIDNKIDSVNQAFCKLNNVCSNKILEMSVDSIFNIYDDKGNELNYRRFQNGIINYCQLTNIQCLKNNSRNLDISFYRGKNHGATHVFAEIVENHNGMENTRANSNIGSNNVHDASFFTKEVKLTAREQQVFELSANGLPTKIIASELTLSERTVEKHRANIMKKADAKNIIEAILHFQNNNNNIEIKEIG